MKVRKLREEIDLSNFDADSIGHLMTSVTKVSSDVQAFIDSSRSLEETLEDLFEGDSEVKKIAEDLGRNRLSMEELLKQLGRINWGE